MSASKDPSGESKPESAPDKSSKDTKIPKNSIHCQLCNSPAEGRNIVLCFDGTSNQFGIYNTNVVELYSKIKKNKHQVTYYNSGIGTYARRSWRSWKHIKQVVDNKIDLMVAWHFDDKVQAGYRWLSERYEEGDKIFLFGYSRGAYQARALAGMIAKVGLIFPGNHEQIPFAYELYADLKKAPQANATAQFTQKQKWAEPPVPVNDQDTEQPQPTPNPADQSVPANNQGIEDSQPPQKSAHADQQQPTLEPHENMAARFKKAFSRPDVRVHFIGVWDTVSSVGIVRGKSLPFTDTFHPDHVCYFRHALALDELRVKFLPEYICGGVSLGEAGTSTSQKEQPSPKDERTGQPTQSGNAEKEKSKMSSISRVKEVWFAGCHGDIGGGGARNEEMNNAAVPVLWMRNEAWLAGLELEESGQGDWNWDELRYSRPRKSLTSVWKVFELLPIKRLSYTNKAAVTRLPHLGQGRIIMPGQKIHASVAFIQNYRPHATFSDTFKNGSWLRILGKGRPDTLEWTKHLEDLVETDLFDYSRIPALVAEVVKTKQSKDVKRLHFWGSEANGRRAILQSIEKFDRLINVAKADDPADKQLIEEILVALYLDVPVQSSRATTSETDDNIYSLLKWIINKLSDDAFWLEDVKMPFLKNTDLTRLKKRSLLHMARVGIDDMLKNGPTHPSPFDEAYFKALDFEIFEPEDHCVVLAAFVLTIANPENKGKPISQTIREVIFRGIKAQGGLLRNEYTAALVSRVLSNLDVDDMNQFWELVKVVFDFTKTEIFAVDILSVVVAKEAQKLHEDSANQDETETLIERSEQLTVDQFPNNTIPWSVVGSSLASATLYKLANNPSESREIFLEHILEITNDCTCLTFEELCKALDRNTGERCIKRWTGLKSLENFKDRLKLQVVTRNRFMRPIWMEESTNDFIRAAAFEELLAVLDQDFDLDRRRLLLHHQDDDFDDDYMIGSNYFDSLPSYSDRDMVLRVLDRYREMGGVEPSEETEWTKFCKERAEQEKKCEEKNASDSKTNDGGNDGEMDNGVNDGAPSVNITASRDSEVAELPSKNEDEGEGSGNQDAGAGIGGKEGIEGESNEVAAEIEVPAGESEDAGGMTTSTEPEEVGAEPGRGSDDVVKGV